MNPYCARIRAARSHTAGDTGSTSRSGDEKKVAYLASSSASFAFKRAHLAFHADQIAYCQALTARQQIGDPRRDLGAEIGRLLDQVDDRVGVQKDHQ